MSNLLQDLLYALRNFARNPIFAAVALLSLALGIGCNTAIFSLMDQVLLRYLPVQHPEQLVLLTDPPPNQGRVSSQYAGDFSFSYPMYREIRDHNPVFSGVLARMPVNSACRGTAKPSECAASWCRETTSMSWAFQQSLGVLSHNRTTWFPAGIRSCYSATVFGCAALRPAAQC